MSGNLHIDWASGKAVTYACMNYHYSKAVPRGKAVKLGVWENKKFMGIVLFSRGASPFLYKEYGLNQKQGCELTRIALQKHEAPVSRILSICIKKLKQLSPDLQLIVSFSDLMQNHHGGIYQASNWIYVGKTKINKFYMINGKKIHPRTVSDYKPVKGRPEGMSILDSIKNYIDPCAHLVEDKGKHKYLYPLNQSMSDKLKDLAKPYPKRYNEHAG